MVRSIGLWKVFFQFGSDLILIEHGDADDESKCAITVEVGCVSL